MEGVTMENAGSRTVDLPNPSDSVAQFEALLCSACRIPNEDDFWAKLGEGMTSLRDGLDGAGRQRFDYAIDNLLVCHGLPPWHVGALRSHSG